MVPPVRAEKPDTTLPPVAASYQAMFEPVTVKSETKGFVPLQKIWVAMPVGAAGVVLTVAVTASLEEDSHPPRVWLA